MLVIIGLIVGGVLVGQSLISAAEVRAQISQIEKYNSAVNTFRSKFNALPGDMTATVASQFGFFVSSGCDGSQPGTRDGNGLLDGWNGPPAQITQRGENVFFWEDLSASLLIDGNYPNSGALIPACNIGLITTVNSANASIYLPPGKIGHGNYVYVYENGVANWFGLSAIISVTNQGIVGSNTVISVSQAYRIDSKIDDGLPNSGNVVAVYLNGGFVIGGQSNAPNTTTAGGTSSSCYDTTTSTYSVTVNNGNGSNCALSFKMQ